LYLDRDFQVYFIHTWTPHCHPISLFWQIVVTTIGFGLDRQGQLICEHQPPHLSCQSETNFHSMKTMEVPTENISSWSPITFVKKKKSCKFIMGKRWFEIRSSINSLFTILLPRLVWHFDQHDGSSDSYMLTKVDLTPSGSSYSYKIINTFCPTILLVCLTDGCNQNKIGLVYQSVWWKLRQL